MTALPDLQDATAVADLFERAAAALVASPLRCGSRIELPARGRLLVTGDLHDNPVHLRKVVGYARLDQGGDHHLVVQELIHGEHLVNGMDFSYRMLARVAHLVLAHPGQVHPLLANHELSQLRRRGVSKGAGDSVRLFHDALAFVFGDDFDIVAHAIDAFIRAMPLALRSDSGVLCAHSLPDARHMKHFDPAVLDRPLTEADCAGPRGSAYLMVWGRGYTDEQVEALAQRWDVTLLCLGHQHTDSGIEQRGRRVLILNSDHDRGAALPIDLARPPAPDEAVVSAMPLQSLPASATV